MERADAECKHFASSLNQNFSGLGFLCINSFSLSFSFCLSLSQQRYYSAKRMCARQNDIWAILSTFDPQKSASRGFMRLHAASFDWYTSAKDQFTLQSSWRFNPCTGYARRGAIGGKAYEKCVVAAKRPPPSPSAKFDAQAILHWHSRQTVGALQ